MYQWCEFKSRRGKNTNWTAQKSNPNTVWFNFQTYIKEISKKKTNKADFSQHSCTNVFTAVIYISNLVWTVPFWNNRHQGPSQSKHWEAKYYKTLCEQKHQGHKKDS